MAVNSKADKKHKHTIALVPVPGTPKGSALIKPSYSAPPAMSGILPQGAKALGLRAKAVLKPDESPDSSPEQ